MPKPNSVLIDRRTFNDIDRVIRDHHGMLTYIDDDTTVAGFYNILLFAGYGYEAPIILIAGES